MSSNDMASAFVFLLRMLLLFVAIGFEVVAIYTLVKKEDHPKTYVDALISLRRAYSRQEVIAASMVISFIATIILMFTYMIG